MLVISPFWKDHFFSFSFSYNLSLFLYFSFLKYCLLHFYKNHQEKKKKRNGGEKKRYSENIKKNWVNKRYQMIIEYLGSLIFNLDIYIKYLNRSGTGPSEMDCKMLTTYKSKISCILSDLYFCSWTFPSLLWYANSMDSLLSLQQSAPICHHSL